MPKCQPNQFELATLLSWPRSGADPSNQCPQEQILVHITFPSSFIIHESLRHRTHSIRVPGLVPEPESQGAEDQQDVGSGQHHGRVRAVRRHGEALPPPPRHDHQAVRDRRVRRALASR